MPTNSNALHIPFSSGMQQDEALAALLSHRPPWIVRWGTIIFLILIMALGAIAWFIRYPDKVSTRGQLLATNGPQALVARRDGRLTLLLQAEGAQVQAGTLIAVLESTTDYKTVVAHRYLADSLYAAMAAQQAFSPAICRRLLSQTGSHLGELEAEYQLFKNALLQYWQYLPGQFYTNHKNDLHKDWQLLRQQDSLIAAQQLLAEEDMLLADQNFAAQSTLANQKIIAPLEWGAEKSKWLGKKMILPQYRASKLSNAAQQLEKQKELAALNNDLALEPFKFRQALEKWIAAIAAWEQQYLFYAPCSGTVAYTRFVNESRYMQAGHVLATVQPDHSRYFIETNLPQSNFGKLALGQQALLRFDAWPYEEFGMVNAQLEKIKPVPSDSGYLAVLSLPQGLVTHKGIALPYKEGLHTSVEIITQDRRLLSRLLAGVVKAFGQ